MFKFILLLFLTFHFHTSFSQDQDQRRLYNVVIEKGESDTIFQIGYEIYLINKNKRDEFFKTESLDTFLMILTRDLKNQKSVKNDLLVYIHGMWGGTNHMFNQASRLMHEAYIDHPESNVARILSIKWPGNTSQYQTNKDVAFALAPQLKGIFDKMLRSIQIIDYLDYQKDYRISLMAHSLGNELIKEFFHYYNVVDLDQKYFDEIILAAPDLDDILFEENQLFCNLHKVADRVHIYFSRKDLTLNVSKALNEKNRMGVSGPSSESVIHDNVCFIDVSDVKDERNLRDRITGHSYYRISEIATSDMRQILVGTPNPEVPKRELTNDQMNIYKLNTEEITP